MPDYLYHLVLNVCRQSFHKSSSVTASMIVYYIFFNYVVLATGMKYFIALFCLYALYS